MKEEEVQLNADLSKINKQIEELKSKLQDFGVSSVQEIQEKMESLEASNKKLQEDIDQIKSATEVASKRRAEQASELASRQKEQAEYRVCSCQKWGRVSRSIRGSAVGFCCDWGRTGQ